LKNPAAQSNIGKRLKTLQCSIGQREFGSRFIISPSLDGSGSGDGSSKGPKFTINLIF
jgi:hypothetical protein